MTITKQVAAALAASSGLPGQPTAAAVAAARAALLAIRNPSRAAMTYAAVKSGSTAVSYHQALIDYELAKLDAIVPVEVERLAAMEGK